jgi:large subunit ribosomal protein L29
MKNEVIRELSIPELNEKLMSAKEQFVSIRLNNAISPIENNNQMRNLKKDIARIKTELRRRELEEQKS